MRRSLISALAIAGCAGPRTHGAPPCPADRTVTLTEQANVARFGGCVTASSLTIRTGAALQLAPLRTLETITGDLIVGPTLALEEISLLELREVSGSIEVTSNAALRGLFLPRLERAGRIAIESNAALVTISMPRLEAVGGSQVITGNGSLELIDVSSLTTVGKDLVIRENPTLTLVEAGQLRRALAVRIERNRTLPPAQIEALRAKTAPE